MNRTLPIGVFVLAGFLAACSSGTPSAPAPAAIAAVETTLGADQARSGSEISGTIGRLSGSCPSIRFLLGRVTVQASATTAFVGGTCANLVNGAVVVVGGARERASMAASSITVRATRTR